MYWCWRMESIVVQNNHPDIQIDWIIIENLRITREDCYLVSEIEEKVRKKITLRELLENEVIRAYRDLFWGLGVDPTKERPSSEALVRRVLRGKKLPRINTAVDAMNAASIETLITFSLLDSDKIEFPLKIRPATGEDKLIVIGGKEIVVPKNFPVIEDNERKLVSATIYRDGDIAKVTEKTKRVLLIGYVPSKIEKSLLKNALKKAKEYIEKCCK